MSTVQYMQKEALIFILQRVRLLRKVDFPDEIFCGGGVVFWSQIREQKKAWAFSNNIPLRINWKVMSSLIQISVSVLTGCAPSNSGEF